MEPIPGFSVLLYFIQKVTQSNAVNWRPWSHDAGMLPAEPQRCPSTSTISKMGPSELLQPEPQGSTMAMLEAKFRIIEYSASTALPSAHREWK